MAMTGPCHWIPPSMGSIVAVSLSPGGPPTVQMRGANRKREKNQSILAPSIPSIGDRGEEGSGL